MRRRSGDFCSGDTVAAPSGKQLSLVFAVEKKLVRQFADRDIGFALGLQFTGGK